MRSELMALTPDSLAALTNRGLLKRATRTVDAGHGPVVTVAPDGAIHGEHPDGIRTTLPTGAGLDAADCDCGAVTTCRHVVALVLAYQRSATTPRPAAAAETVNPASQAPAWSPGEFSDEAVERLIGARAMAAARRRHRAGYAARVRRPTPADPVPAVELPACTVRFLVPHDLSYVHTDTAPGSGTEALALAVWAFRVADASHPDAGEVQVQVGGRPSALGSALAEAVRLAGEILLEGAVHIGPGIATTLAGVRRDLAREKLRWPALAIEELHDQLDAYRHRSARYQPELLAELLAELPTRQRAAAGQGLTPRSQVLGTEEAAETRLRRVRLTGLGCRIGGNAEERTAEVFLADPNSGTVLVLHRRWAVDDPPPAAELAQRRVAGHPLAALATGHVVTESALRSARRRLRLASSRVAATTVTPSAGAWDTLPASLLVRDVAKLAEALDRLPPRPIRARVDAEAVRVMEVGEVLRIGYAPGQQRLEALVTDPGGVEFVVSAAYRSICPSALDSVAAALNGDLGPPRFLSGTVRRTQGGVVVTPIAVVTGDTVVVPDLAEGGGHLPTTPASAAADTDLATILSEAQALLAEVAHHGARHLPPSFPARLHHITQELSRVGLRRCAAAVETFAATLSPDPGIDTVTAWVDAHLRLLVTADYQFA